MDKLPNELLSHIFSIIVSRPDQDPAFVRVLSRVCARWRRVSIATGNLWTRINVTLPLSEQQHLWTQTCLTRSTAYPLDILIDLRDPEWDWNEELHLATWEIVVPFIRLLIQQSMRWRTFEMLTDNWAPIFAFLIHTKTKLMAPKLEVLSLSRCNAYLAARGQTFQPRNLGESLPLLGGQESELGRLSTVTLVGVHVEWNNTVLRNLRQLEFKYQSREVMPTPDQFCQILESCPGLISLSIVGWGPLLDVTITYPGMFFLPSLKELTIGFVEVAYAVQLLSCFRMPNLQSFVLEDTNPLLSPLSIQNASQLLDWLSSCHNTSSSSTVPASPFHLRSLRSLELRCIRAEKQSFLKFLKRLELLKSLSCINMLDDILDCLCSQNGGNGVYVCPELAELYCVDVNPHALIRVACSRGLGDGVGSIQQVKMSFLPNRRPAVTVRSEIFQELLQAGIEIVESDH